MTLQIKKYIMTEKDIKRQQVMEKLVNKELKNSSAGKLLNMSSRQIIRLKKSYKLGGIEGILHKLRGKDSNHKGDEFKYEKALFLIKEKYSDYGPTLASEVLEEKHGIRIKSGTLRLQMIKAGIFEHKERKKTEKQYLARPRRESFGEMIQYDGTYHLWFEGRNGTGMICLLVGVDDATGKVEAKFTKNEGLEETFKFWKGYSEKYGKPKSIYLDKFATYKVNYPNATDDKELPTQFGRVCKKVGIELIFANSPQAKGRVERMNKTLQNRLLKALREENISDIENANKFLKEIFLPKFNAKFMVEPRNIDNLHLELTKEEKENINQIFSEHKVRKIINDYTISFERKVYQLYRTKNSKYYIGPGLEVTVEKHLDGSIHISKNGEYIENKLLEEKPKRRNNFHTAPIIEKQKNSKLKDYVNGTNKKDSKNITLKEKKEKLVFANKQADGKEDCYYLTL